MKNGKLTGREEEKKNEKKKRSWIQPGQPGKQKQKEQNRFRTGPRIERV